MDPNYSLLDLSVPEGKDVGKERVIYSFKKEEHARLLLDNLAEMQSNKGLLTDMVMSTASKDYEVPIHSMLLAACSPVLKRSLTGKHFDCIDGVLSLNDYSAEVLKAFRDFMYKAKLPSDEKLVNSLKAFAARFDIASLAKLCKENIDQPNSHREDVLSQLYEMFQEKELATTLLEDGEGNAQYAVHGPLVASASPVLREILSNYLFCGEGTKYRLREVRSNILEDLLQYIYTGEVTLEGENVVGLLNAASRYEIPALCMTCCNWLWWHLDSYNAIGILWLAKKTNGKYSKDLEEEAKTFIITNFANVWKEAEFDELECEDLKEIIQHDNLCVNREEEVFYAVAKWMEADEEVRSPHMEVLLQCVRLENTSLEFLCSLQEDPRIAKSARCLQIVQEAQEKLLQAPVKQEDIKRNLLDDFLRNAETEQPEPEPESEDVSLPRRLRKNGEPDMRFKENRRSLGQLNKDGSPDMRFKINKEKHGESSSQEEVKGPKGQKEIIDDVRPLKKDGTPDRRFKVNKGDVAPPSSPEKAKGPKGQKGVVDDHDGRPLKKDGTPDRRFKVNKGDVAPSSQTSSPRETTQISGPCKKDGTPDMRFAINKAPTGDKSSPVAKTPSSGSVATPLKRDGTPDMRFAVNKQASSPVASSQTSSPLPQSSYTRGPVKKDGTPDMRYAVNKQSVTPSPSSSYGGSPMSSGYSSGGSSYSAGSSSSGSVFGSSSCGPLKRDGTPDMRYAVNKSSYGSASSSGYSSGGASYSSRSYSSGGAYRSSPCGPLKSNGTPDMRFKANRR